MKFLQKDKEEACIKAAKTALVLNEDALFQKAVMEAYEDGFWNGALSGGMDSSIFNQALERFSDDDE